MMQIVSSEYSFTFSTLEENKLFLVTFQLVFSNEANCLFRLFNARKRHLRSPHWKKTSCSWSLFNQYSVMMQIVSSRYSFTISTLEENKLFLVTFQIVFSNDANCFFRIFIYNLHIGRNKLFLVTFQLVFSNDANFLLKIFSARIHHLLFPHWKKTSCSWSLFN